MQGYLRTTILLAGLTALFVAVGFMIGGGQGMLLAFGLAVAMNVFAYWNSDKMVLRMYGAQPVDERSAPELHRIVADLAAQIAPVIDDETVAAVLLTGGLWFAADLTRALQARGYQLQAQGATLSMRARGAP